MKNKLAVLSLSGGMDSTCLLLHLLAKEYRVDCYSFYYGQKHNIELERLKSNISLLQEKGFPVKYSIIDLTDVFKDSTSALLPGSGVEVPEGYYNDDNMKETVVENRNGIFSSIIYAKALSLSNKTKEKVIISLGVHAGDEVIYPDCRVESRDAFAYAFKISNWGSENISYYTPYISVFKYDILKDAQQSCMKLNLDFSEILKNTNTCYNPSIEGEACGKCGSCQERLEAFKKLGIVDPVKYQE